MKQQRITLDHREQQIARLLLQGCDNSEIALQLEIATRTVKVHFSRLFVRFAITSGAKRVKLATFLYRRQLSSENDRNNAIYATNANDEREQQVIQLVSAGLNNQEVAKAIGATEYIVKNCLRIIYDRLCLWNRVELALWHEARRHEQR